MFYFLWIPITILLYATIGWLSVRVNVSDNKFWYIPFIIIQMCPFWVIVARYSKNLVIDAMLYDILIFLVTSISIGIFSGSFIKFNVIQYIGFLLIISGFILIQIRG